MHEQRGATGKKKKRETPGGMRTLIFGSSGSLGGRRRRLHLPDVGLDYSIHHWLSFITFYYILPIGRSWLVLEFFFASSVANSHFSEIAENLPLTFSSFYFAIFERS